MNPFFVRSPQVASYYESLLSPVKMEYVNVQSNEYIEGETLSIYLPVAFNMLSVVLNTIDRYSNLSNEKWLNLGYKRPLDETFTNTRSFLTLLPERYLYSLQAEDIEPTPYGTFVLDFNNNDDIVSIEIGKDKIGYFTKYLSKKNRMSPGITFIENNAPEEIIEALEDILI